MWRQIEPLQQILWQRVLSRANSPRERKRKVSLLRTRSKWVHRRIFFGNGLSRLFGDTQQTQIPNNLTTQPRAWSKEGMITIFVASFVRGSTTTHSFNCFTRSVPAVHPSEKKSRGSKPRGSTESKRCMTSGFTESRHSNQRPIFVFPVACSAIYCSCRRLSGKTWLAHRSNEVWNHW